MEPRVAALEEGMKEIKAALKEIQAGQQAAAIKAVEQSAEAKLQLAGIDAKFIEIKSSFSGVDTKFAETAGKLGTMQGQIDGKLSNLQTQSDGLRRDVEKLPTDWGVAKVLVFVVTGLGATAVLIKNVWPMLSKLFGP